MIGALFDPAFWMVAAMLVFAFFVAPVALALMIGAWSRRRAMRGRR